MLTTRTNYTSTASKPIKALASWQLTSATVYHWAWTSRMTWDSQEITCVQCAMRVEHITVTNRGNKVCIMRLVAKWVTLFRVLEILNSKASDLVQSSTTSAVSEKSVVVGSASSTVTPVTYPNREELSWFWGKKSTSPFSDPMEK